MVYLALFIWVTTLAILDTCTGGTVAPLRNDPSVKSGTRLVDISNIFDQIKRNNSRVFELFKSDYNANSGDRLMFYYETDLDDAAIPKLKDVVSWATILASDTDTLRAEVLFSLRYSTTEYGQSFSIMKEKPLLPKHFRSIKGKLRNIASKNKISFEYTGTNNSCPNGVDDTKLGPTDVTRFKSEFWENSKQKFEIGYTINESLLKCSYFFESMLAADFFILKVNFEHYTNFVESYSAFKSYMDLANQQAKLFLTGIRNDDSDLFYHLKYVQMDLTDVHKATANFRETNIRTAIPKNHNETSYGKTVADGKYKCLFQKFVLQWISESRAAVILELGDDFGNSCQTNSRVNSNIVLEVTDRFLRPEITYWQPNRLAIESIIDQGFQSVMLTHSPSEDNDKLEMILKTFSHVLQRDSPFRGSNAIQMSVSISFIDIFNFDLLPKQVQRILHIVEARNNTGTQYKASGIKIKNFVIDIDDISTNNEKASLRKISNKTDLSCLKTARGITSKVKGIGGSDTSDSHRLEFVRHIYKSWDIMELCDEFILRTILFIDSTQLHLLQQPIYTDAILETLKERVFTMKNIIQSQWPNKTLSLQIIPMNLDLVDSSAYSKDEPEGSETLYCSQKLAGLCLYFEAILAWAEIYEIPVVLSFGGDASSTPLISWMHVMEDDNVLPRVGGKFPLYVRRSYNNSKIFGSWTRGMHQCLEWQINVPTTDIVNPNIIQLGTYLTLHTGLDERKISDAEILTLLLFSTGTFHMTEVKVCTDKELRSVLGILGSDDFQQSLNISKAKPELFINIPIHWFRSMQNLLQSMINGLESSLNSQTVPLNVYIHISSDWKMKTVSSRKVFEKQLDILNLKKLTRMGIQVNDCAEVVNDLVEKQNETEIIRQLPLIGNLSYIVCVVPSRDRVADKREEMQQFLETHVYIKTILQTFFPNLRQVYFKLQPSIRKMTNESAEEFLLLLAHIVQFSKEFNIPFFLLPAIPSNSSDVYSWWEVDNYSDLSDPTAFTDIQNKYHGTQPRRPNIRKENTDADEGEELPEIMFWIIVGLIISVTSLIVIIGILVLRARRNAKLLSDAEVQEFIRGRAEAEATKHFGNDFNGQLVHGKYKNHYEICKSEISLERHNILGMGNFGIVYKASLNSVQGQTQFVAVKMPREGSDKQTFLGMLREVKLLAHLGNHDNLVRFIGSYTKEIQSGILYIVMELCNGGSLLSHLKELKGNSMGRDMILGDLVHFCLDIASGMEFIASKNVIHGDLSARNVLLDEQKICKISDFGLSRKLYEYSTYKKKTEEPLPWRWMSFESLTDMQFSTKSDVWSYGVTAWEIFSLGETPYAGYSWTKEFLKELEDGVRLAVPAFATTIIHEKLMTCWDIDPAQRPTFTDLIVFFKAVLPYADIL